MIPTLSNLTLEIHIVLFAVLMILVILAGFMIGRNQIKQKEKRILELENEMLASHKEILKYATLNKQMSEALEKAKIPFPVTRMEEDEDEKVRKIPLGKIG
ncbi:MAG: hypothetical protein QM725_11295 [Lacibacter sp.]